MREFHFYGSEAYVPDDVRIFHGVKEIYEEIDRMIDADDGQDVVLHTTQCCALRHIWARVYGCTPPLSVAIVIHNGDGAFTVAPEKYGGCARTAKELRAAHNIDKMYLAGAFGEKF